MFDLQVEAETLGCKLAWRDDNPPAVMAHPLSESRPLTEFKVPSPADGRIPIVMEACRRLRKQHPDLALYGLITGPFTLALHMLGTNIFTDMMMVPDQIHDLMRFTTKVTKMMADSYVRAGADVIAVVDPMTSQIDPGSFELFVSPYISEINELIRESGALSSLFVCGNAQQNIEVMCQTRPDNISIDENIPLDYVRDTALMHDVSFGGNMRLTVVLLLGDEDTSRREALQCMDTGGKKGFILAPGCDLPMETPAENLAAVSELVRDEMLQGKLRASAVKGTVIEKLDLSKHWSKEKVIIDIITLDSSSCAPCQYMVDAVERAARSFGDKVVFKEHRIKEEEGIKMMVSLGVQNLPSIVMDNHVEFISRIPPVSKIKERIAYHLSTKK